MSAKDRMDSYVRSLSDKQLKTVHRELSLKLRTMRHLEYGGDNDKRATNISCLAVESEALRRGIDLPFRSMY